MRIAIVFSILLYICHPVTGQYKYYQYKDMAVLYDSVKSSIRYYYDEKGSMESFKFITSQELQGVGTSDKVYIDIAANDEKTVTVLAMDESKKENQVYRVWRFTCNKAEFKSERNYTIQFEEAPVFRGFSWGGIGFIIKKGKKEYLVNGPKSSDWEKLPDNRATFDTRSSFSPTMEELAYIEDEDSRKKKEEARYNASVQEAIRATKEREEWEAIRKKREDSIQNVEFKKQFAAQKRAEDSLRNLPPGIRIENSTHDLIYTLNAWANQFNERTDIVTKIANCKNSNSSCMVDNYKKLKRLFGDLSDRLYATAAKMSKDYTSAWDLCDSARKYYGKGTGLLESAYRSFNSAYEAARKIADQYNNMVDADYNLWVQVMYKSYDEGDVMVQDAYYYLYTGYDRYLAKKCPSIKQGSLAKDGNVLLQTLVGWQPILRQKLSTADMQRANNERIRKEANAKAEAKRKESGVCDNCHGSGYEPEYKKCWFCGGDGVTSEIVTGEKTIGTKKVYKETSTLGTQDKYEWRDIKSVDIKGKKEVSCSQCKGTGQVKTGKKISCHVCHGSGKP